MDSVPPPTAGSSSRKWLRRTLTVVVVLAILLAGAAYIAYRSFVLPNQKLADINWLQQASSAEVLDVSHRVLALPWGNHHDAFIYVADLGGPESVPILIRALKWQGHTEPGGVMDCGKAHCLEALAQLTGQKVGANYEDWKKWWDSVGHQVPSVTTRPASRPAQGS
ncbi:MAG TPA: hypothetical protein PKG54_18560 [Phycisphaerae bacterium]|jgi:hypothetical protein|nr:hypothetical protein [Phycisphaerae bacterium]HOB76516.1 hypothetical protein [Phycisphaerae bacterium]HOJ56070.1 hypothetical protein [Phycisphaerae bacterium]HOL28300.1 hypothetical protein [Phycisphaerae bacterium]HPP22774.1 hypothetical protein [Phycisphaerae bacterium]